MRTTLMLVALAAVGHVAEPAKSAATPARTATLSCWIEIMEEVSPGTWVPSDGLDDGQEYQIHWSFSGAGEEGSTEVKVTWRDHPLSEGTWSKTFVFDQSGNGVLGTFTHTSFGVFAWIDVVYHAPWHDEECSDMDFVDPND